MNNIQSYEVAQNITIHTYMYCYIQVFGFFKQTTFQNVILTPPAYYRLLILFHFLIFRFYKKLLLMFNSKNRNIDATSLSLLKRLKSNTSDSWQQLFELYGPLVYYWCKRANLQNDDSEDVVQDVFKSVSSSIQNFKKDKSLGSFRGWLWTITRNQINQHFRNKSKQDKAIGGSVAKALFSELPIKEPPEFDEPSKNNCLSSLMLRCIQMVKNDFQENTWSAFELTALNGMTSREASEITGMNVASVRKAKSRVLKRIRDEFLELIDEDQLQELTLGS
jgi:RNA polymerase sigma-70 factor, ECF subfamily